MRKQSKRKSSPRKKAVIKTKEKVERITIKSLRDRVIDLESRCKIDKLATIETLNRLRRRIDTAENLFNMIEKSYRFWNLVFLTIQLIVVGLFIWFLVR